MNATSKNALAHVVTWRFNGTTAEERTRQAQRVAQAFEALRGDIPGLLRMDVGANTIEVPQAWDLALCMVFASRAHLEAYQVHPAHLHIKALVAPMRADRGRVDFPVTA